MTRILQTNSGHDLRFLPLPKTQIGGSLAWLAFINPFLELPNQQDAQPFQVESQTRQTPFSGSGAQTTQRELPESYDFLDDPNHRFHSRFAQFVDCLIDLSFEFVRHFDHGDSILRRGIGQLCKLRAPALVLGITTSGDVRLDPALLHYRDIGHTEVPRIQRRGLRCADCRRNGVQGGKGFIAICRMIRQAATIKKLS